jgi:hypothetical protein
MICETCGGPNVRLSWCPDCSPTGLTREEVEALEAGAFALECEGLRARSGADSPPESIPKSDKAANARWVQIKSAKIAAQITTLRNLAARK